MSSQNRRQFLQGCAVAGGAAFLLSAAESKSLLIESLPSGSLHRRLAEGILRGLTRLQPAADVKFTASASSSQTGPVFRLRVDAGNFKNKESYSISARDREITVSAATDLDLLLWVFDFLEIRELHISALMERVIPQN